MILMIGLGQIYSVQAKDVEGTTIPSGSTSKNPEYSSELGKLDAWDPSKQRDNADDAILVRKANHIVTVIRNVGIVVSVIALMVIGLKEMTASVEEKSIIKQAMPGYIIGAILVLAITTLPSVIFSLIN